MLTRYRNRGITLIGFLMLMAVVGFFAYLAMRLIPMYSEYMGVVKSMQQIKEEPGAANMSPEQVRRKLSVAFDMQYIESGAIPPEVDHGQARRWQVLVAHPIRAQGAIRPQPRVARHFRQDGQPLWRG
jgi:hypothetical protein